MACSSSFRAGASVIAAPPAKFLYPALIVLAVTIWTLHTSDAVWRVLINHTPTRAVTLEVPPFQGWYVQAKDDDVFDPNIPEKYIVQYTQEGLLFGLAWQEPPSTRVCPPVNNSTITLVINDKLDSIPPGKRFRHIHVWHAGDDTARWYKKLASRPRKKHDVYVLYNLEPPGNYPEYLDAEHISSFDLDITYRPMHATAAQLYLPPKREWLDLLKRPSERSWKEKSKKYVLVGAISNCNDHNGRSILVRALQQHLGTAFVNFGACHPSNVTHSSAEPHSNHMGAFDNNDALEEAIKQSNFVLAVENANCDSYITEKLVRAVRLGAIPVVFDAPQSLGDGPDDTMIPGYKDVMPPGTYVNIADFESIASLSNYLLRVGNDEKEYKRFLWTKNTSDSLISSRWWQLRRYGGSSSQASSMEERKLHTKCALAHAALKRGENGVGPRLEPDLSCLPDRVLCNKFKDMEGCTSSSINDRVKPVLRKHDW